MKPCDESRIGNEEGVSSDVSDGSEVTLNKDISTYRQNTQHLLTRVDLQSAPSMSFYPNFILTLSRFYPDFIQILSR